MPEERLRAGSAQREITPDRDVPLISIGTGDRWSEGVHDPLTATALVLSDGTVTVGVVSLELLVHSRAFTGRVRRRVAEEPGGVDELVVATTHTHSAPISPDHALKINPSVSVPQVTGEAATAALAAIEDAAVEAVREAHDALAPAELRVGTAENTETPANRRSVAGVRDGLPRDGPIDPELVVLDVETATGEETVLYSFACHPVCVQWDPDLSADWPGRVRERVTGETDATVLFLNGALGDINPRDYSHDRRGEDAYEYMREVGDEVADTVLAARATARDTPPVTDVPITADHRSFRLPAKDTPAPETLREQLQRIEADLDRLENEGDEEALSYRSGERFTLEELLELADWGGTEFPVSMQYVGVGDFGLLAVPGEPFVEHGLAFKEAADAGTLAVAALSNEFVGYVPTLSELEFSGYEVKTAKVAPRGIATYRREALDLVRR